MAKAIIEMNHGLKIAIPNARVYKETGIHGETIIISDGSNNNFILFRGVRGCFLKSPRLFRRSVPVKFIYA